MQHSPDWYGLHVNFQKQGQFRTEYESQCEEYSYGNSTQIPILGVDIKIGFAKFVACKLNKGVSSLCESAMSENEPKRS